LIIISVPMILFLILYLICLIHFKGILRLHCHKLLMVWLKKYVFEFLTCMSKWTFTKLWQQSWEIMQNVKYLKVYIKFIDFIQCLWFLASTISIFISVTVRLSPYNVGSQSLVYMGLVLLWKCSVNSVYVYYVFLLLQICINCKCWQ